MSTENRFRDEGEAITYVFRSMVKLRGIQRGLDEDTRSIAPTRRLLQACNLLSVPREYAVITGSKGKGSTAVIAAKLLQHLGHTVGLITSPHLVSYRERIRVNGRAIPTDDLLRILSDLAPEIDAIEATFTGLQYISPQGIFLAVALRWFDEQKVNAAVLEVGRGGRYDDIAVVPNKLSLFTPILLEHTAQLGSTVERIAWHKAGIIKSQSYAYSVPQPTSVLEVLQAEADAQDAEFNWLGHTDMGQYLGKTERGLRMSLGRYGELDLSLHGRYEIENASLAVQGVGNMHGRLPGMTHGSPEYVEAIRAGLADVIWPGRLQKLQDHPAIWLDGTTTVVAAHSVLDSFDGELTHPLITVLGVPIDRDYAGVYQVFAPVSDALVLTETDINEKIKFPPKEVALATARQYHGDVSYGEKLPQAIDIARAKAGTDGTIILAVTLPLVGEAVQMWGWDFEQI